MKAALLSIALVALVAFAGCSSISVSTNFDSGADFASYKTFGWMKESDSEKGYDFSGELDERIKNAVDQQLAAKGLMKATVNTDLLVVYHAGKEQQLEEEDWGYGGWWGVGGGDVNSYEKGTLVVDLIDAKTEKLVWRGSANKALSENPSAGEREEAIDDAVQKMFKKYPPSG
jgi:hypothetical protein